MNDTDLKPIKSENQFCYRLYKECFQSFRNFKRSNNNKAFRYLQALIGLPKELLMASTFGGTEVKIN